jgi:hypothetical protein
MIPGSNEPSYITHQYAVKDPNYPILFTFCSGEGNNREIYIRGEYYNSIKITDNPYFDNKPEIFYGKFYYYYFNAVIIWQSHINNQSVLYMSQKSVDIGGGIGDNKKNNDQFLKTSPNPFKDKLAVEYFISDNNKVSIDIYSINGKPIGHMNIDNPQMGWNKINWKPSANLPEGIYFIVLKQGNKTSVNKVIRTK